MNQRTVLIIIAVVLLAVIIFRSWHKVTIKKTSDDDRTTFNVDIKKEKQVE